MKNLNSNNRKKVNKNVVNIKLHYFQLKLENVEKNLNMLKNELNDHLLNDKSDVSKDSKKFELLKQLHQHHDESDNNKKGYIVSFLAAVFVVFVGYGTIYINDDYSNYLFIITFLSFSILFIINLLCLNFGFMSKTEQLIAYEIRSLYGLSEIYRNPYKNWNYIPDFYKIMIWGIQFYIVFLLCLSLYKEIIILERNEYILLYFLVFCIVIILEMTCFLYFKYQFKNNKERLKNYFNKENIPNIQKT